MEPKSDRMMKQLSWSDNASSRRDKDQSPSSALREKEISILKRKIQDLEEQHAIDKENLKIQLEEAMKKRLVK